jgi:hypothetical protein
MEESHTPLFEEIGDGLAELDPSLSAAPRRHEVAADEAPSENGLVPVGVPHGGLEGDTPEPPE